MRGVPFALLIPLLAPAALAQTVRHVPGDHPTIQTAIVAAGAGDLILVAPGTYREFLDFLGKPISVVGTGGAAQTIVDVSGLVSSRPSGPEGAVLFINGEGPGSVLQGLTITGFDAQTGQNAPVYSEGAPTLVGVRIAGNRGSLSGGFFGGGTLSGCVIEDNFGHREGAGVRGTAQLYDCIIRRNTAFSSNGGGIGALPGLRAVRCTITENVASNDGHSGGGVDGPAELVDCLIARNVGNSFAGQNLNGTSAVNEALLIDGCTITDNEFQSGGGYAVSAETIVDSIIGGNDEDMGEIKAATSITYSDIEGGWPGTGNISRPPLFVDPDGGDYRLRRASPCIDAGDPASPPDPDGTRADMGAFFVPQHPASWSLRFGSVPAIECVATSDPVIGTTFTVEVTAGSGVNATFVAIHALPASPIPTPFGELLIDLASPRLALDMAAPSGGVGVHDFAIPNDTALIGAQASLQGLRVDGSASLTANAVDFTIGL